jgi:hypothetical protein
METLVHSRRRTEGRHAFELRQSDPRAQTGLYDLDLGLPLALADLAPAQCQSSVSRQLTQNYVPTAQVTRLVLEEEDNPAAVSAVAIHHGHIGACVVSRLAAKVCVTSRQRTQECVLLRKVVVTFL